MTYASILKNPKANVNDIKADFSFKIVLVGEPGVGKTSLFNRIKSDVFSNHVTIGLDNYNKFVFLENGKIVKLDVWDTAGQERFQTITKNYYRHADAVLFVFAVNDFSTFSALMKWNEDVVHILSDEVYKVLVGNKKDCPTVLKPRSIRDFCDVRNCGFSCATSALTGEGINEMLNKISLNLISRHQPPSDNNVLDVSVDTKQSHCTC